MLERGNRDAEKRAAQAQEAARIARAQISAVALLDSFVHERFWKCSIHVRRFACYFSTKLAVQTAGHLTATLRDARKIQPPCGGTWTNYFGDHPTLCEGSKYFGCRIHVGNSIQGFRSTNAGHTLCTETCGVGSSQQRLTVCSWWTVAPLIDVKVVAHTGESKRGAKVFYRNTTFAAIFLMGGMVSLKSHDQGFTILTIGNLGTSTWTSTFGTFGCIFSQWGKVTAWRPSTLEPDRFFPIFFWGVSLVMFWRLGGGFMMPCWRFEEVIGQVSMEVHSMDNSWKVSIPWRAAPCTAQLPNQPPLSDSTGWWFRSFELRNAPPKWPLN